MQWNPRENFQEMKLDNTFPCATSLWGVTWTEFRPALAIFHTRLVRNQLYIVFPPWYFVSVTPIGNFGLHTCKKHCIHLLSNVTSRRTPFGSTWSNLGVYQPTPDILNPKSPSCFTIWYKSMAQNIRDIQASTLKKESLLDRSFLITILFTALSVLNFVCFPPYISILCHWPITSIPSSFEQQSSSVIDAHQFLT